MVNLPPLSGDAFGGAGCGTSFWPAVHRRLSMCAVRSSATYPTPMVPAHFLAPERPDKATELLERMDTFSFGAFLYFAAEPMVPSSRPRDQRVQEALRALVQAGPRPLPTDPWQRVLIERCWNLTPELRPSLPELFQVIRLFFQFERVELPPLRKRFFPATSPGAQELLSGLRRYVAKRRGPLLNAVLVPDERRDTYVQVARVLEDNPTMIPGILNEVNRDPSLLRPMHESGFFRCPVFADPQMRDYAWSFTLHLFTQAPTLISFDERPMIEAGVRSHRDEAVDLFTGFLNAPPKGNITGALELIFALGGELADAQFAPRMASAALKMLAIGKPKWAVRKVLVDGFFAGFLSVTPDRATLDLLTNVSGFSLFNGEILAPQLQAMPARVTALILTSRLVPNEGMFQVCFWLPQAGPLGALPLLRLADNDLAAPVFAAHDEIFDVDLPTPVDTLSVALVLAKVPVWRDVGRRSARVVGLLLRALAINNAQITRSILVFLRRLAAPEVIPFWEQSGVFAQAFGQVVAHADRELTIAALGLFDVIQPISAFCPSFLALVPAFGAALSWQDEHHLPTTKRIVQLAEYAAAGELLARDVGPFFQSLTGVPGYAELAVAFFQNLQKPPR